MRLIDKDNLIETLHMYFGVCMGSDDHIDPMGMFIQILRDIEIEPEVMTVQNPVTREIEVYMADDVFDQEEIVENCTVQILTNSKTGATSVGWWRNE